MPKLSIIIPCYLLYDSNGDSELLRFTKDCLQSIEENFTIDYELVLIDNGSEVGMNYLEEKADTFIRNDKNLGYGPAINQGLRLSRGYWLLACNNDIVFYSDWAKDAIDNWVENTGVVSSHLSDIPREDSMFGVYRWNHFFGACWLINRDILNSVGFLDEQFKIGMFEDRDLARRIHEAGYDLAKGGWVKHVGNATWGKIPGQEKIYLENKRKFQEKWGN